MNEHLSMVQREKELRTKLENLNREKHERVKKLKQLREEDERLCQALCSTPFYVPSNIVPSREQLQELEAHVKGLLAEKVVTVNISLLNFFSTKFHPKHVRVLNCSCRKPASLGWNW